MSAAKRLWPLAGGFMEADLGQIHFGDSGKLSLPLPAFLIEHERGLVLLNTGCRPDAHDRPPPEVYGDVVASAWPLECPPRTGSTVRSTRQVSSLKTSRT